MFGRSTGNDFKAMEIEEGNMIELCMFKND